MRIWFTSDLHFGHANILKFTKRPYKDIEEMTRVFIQNYNKCVKKNDICYFIGDIFWSTMKTQDIKNILKELNGKKILILGNHDKLTLFQGISYGFDSVFYQAKIKHAGMVFVLNHYPAKPSIYRRIYSQLMYYLGYFKFPLKGMEKRIKVNSNEILLYGHTHANSPFEHKVGINIGIDAWDYKPVSIDELVNIINTKK